MKIEIDRDLCTSILHDTNQVPSSEELKIWDNTIQYVNLSIDEIIMILNITFHII